MRRLFGSHHRLSIGVIFLITVTVLGVACAGDSGATGAQGQTGIQGPPGDAGAAGQRGSAGAQGSAGTQGLAGAQGLAGPQGPAGAQSSAGPAGAPGVQGPSGPNGLSAEIISVLDAPVLPDGRVAGSLTEFVINLGVPLDPNVPGKTLLKGNTIKITFPDAFENTGAPAFQGVGTENCAPGNLQCTTGVLLQGWPQHPIRPPFQKYEISLEGRNTVVFTALEDLLPEPPLEPGIKQIHLILKRFRNPDPGQYGIRIAAETGPGGEMETGWGQLQIIPQTRPAISVTSAFNPGSPNTIYQEAEPGELTPFNYDLLLWGSQGEPLEGVTITEVDNGGDPASPVGNFVQGGNVVGQIFLDGPNGVTGQVVFTESPSVEINAPITGVPTGHLVASFRAGTTSGDYLVTFALNGGNSIQMTVTVP